MTVERLDVTPENPCFDQMAMFVLILAGQHASLCLFDTFDYISEALSTQSEIVPGEFDLPGALTICTVGYEGNTRILNMEGWLNYLSGEEPNRPDRVSFITSFDNQAEGVGQSPEPPIEGRMNEARFFIEQLVCSSIGMAYEANKTAVKAVFGSNPLDFPPEFQFFRHARNACFHGNILDIRPFRGNPTIDPKNPPAWRDLVIPDDSVNGIKFADRFFPFHLTLLFLTEIGEMLRAMDT